MSFYGDTIEYLLDSGARTDILIMKDFTLDSAFDRDLGKQALCIERRMEFQ